MKLLRGLATLALAAALAAPAAAQVPPHGGKIAVTRHQVVLNGGKVLKYTARAGLLPLYVNDTGELMGNVFFMAYVADAPKGTPPRPLTFLWNGGPGSNSGQVHVVGFGPKRVTTAATYPKWGPDTETPLIDQPETWLETSDLVFVDPPGTGFSRATTKAFRDILYSPRGDAEATAEMIRVYLNRYDAWNQPLFLAGESYGVTRAMLTAEALESRRTHLKGVVLISNRLDIGAGVPEAISNALYIPHFAAAAWYHKALPADLQALSQAEAMTRAETWARTVYAPALGKIAQLTPAERAEILAGIKRFTGVEGKYADPKTLTLSVAAFGDQLLADKGLELGRYDFRMTKPSRAKDQVWMTWIDPSLIPMMDLMEGTSRVFNAYVRKDLGFESDLLYRGPFGRAFHPEPLVINPVNGYADDWMGSMFDYSTPIPRGKESRLLKAMQLNPRLQIMTMKGLYDSAPCAQPTEETAYAPSALKSRITNACYPAGHMWYSDLDNRRLAKRDFDGFIRKATAAQ